MDSISRSIESPIGLVYSVTTNDTEMHPWPYTIKVLRSLCAVDSNLVVKSAELYDSSQSSLC